MRPTTPFRKALPAVMLGAFLLAAARPAPAQHSGAGTDAIFEFLNISYDARSVALAGASTALPSGVYGMLSNPASLAFVPAPQVFTAYRPIIAGVFGIPVAYALPRAGSGVFGFSVSGLTSGSINVTDQGPDGGVLNTGGKARADYLAGNAAWAMKMSDYFGAGIAAKGIYNYLSSGSDYWSADGLAFDAGMQYRFLNSRLIYGFTVRNIGVLMSGFEKDDHYSLPSVVEIGVSYVPRDISTLRVALDINKQRDDYLNFEPGAELEILKNQMVLRGGYSFSWRDLEAFKNMLAGNSEDNYYKSNRAALCLGAGFLTELGENKVSLDAALEFSTVPVLPAFVVSLLVSL